MRLFVIAAAVLLAACENQSAVPDGDPRRDRETGLTGFVYPEDAIAEAGGRIGWAQAAIEAYARITTNDVPARIEPLDTTSCIVAKPAAGDLVRHVFVERGAGEAPIFQIQDADLDGRASAARDRHRVVNVAVTEKSAPVYLVLSSESNVIWNILAAEGVTISAIAAISGDGVGLAGAPPGAEIQAYYGEALTRCAITPARRPQDDWMLTRNARKAGGAQREALDALRDKADSYDVWLAKWFGADVQKSAVTQQGAGAVLIGPMPASPDERAVMRPLAGSTVKLSLADHVVVGGLRDYEDALARLRAAAANGAAGS